MAALRVEQSCLACHTTQGYKVGDIIGGISSEAVSYTHLFKVTLLYPLRGKFFCRPRAAAAVTPKGLSLIHI